MKNIIVFMLLLLFASQVFAIGSVTQAKIVQIRVDYDGRAMIFFDQPIGGSPATCVHDAYKMPLR